MPIKKIDYQNYLTPSDYMKFDQGETDVVIVGNGGMCRMHGLKTALKYVNLGICTEDDTCEQCKRGNEAKLRWMWIVYLPKYKTVRLMETGKMLGDQICKIRNNEDPQGYIITVTKQGEKLKTEYFAKLGDKYQFTEEEESFIEPAKQFLITKHFK